MSDDVDRANQLFRLDALPPAASPLVPLTPLITLMVSDLSFPPLCPAALLIRFSFFASSFGSTGMGGRSCATNDFLDSAYDPRLPFPSRLGRCVLERAFMRELGSPAPCSFRDDLSYIEVAPGLRLPLARAARSPWKLMLLRLFCPLAWCEACCWYAAPCDWSDGRGCWLCVCHCDD